jgi:membrane-anchored protein YejM (alkaline phosphatase superfamily)
MEIRIVVFLAFISFTLITNTLLIWLAYKAFTSLTSNVTETVSKFAAISDNREWIATLESASEQAISVTEATKARMAEVDAALEKAQQRYHRTLTKVDSKLEAVAGDITTNARKMRDVIAGPAFSIVSFAAGISQVLDDTETGE